MKPVIKVFGVFFLSLLTGCQKTVIESATLQQGDPIQTSTHEPIFKMNQSTIEPVADYTIRARVLAKESYHMDNFSKVSPWDMVLGWDTMEDAEITQKWEIDISQSGRFYYWKIPIYDEHHIKTIRRNSANVHMIPHNSYVKKQLDEVVEDGVYEFTGYLVNVTTSKRSYISSTSREDTGAGACEIFYVKFIHRIA